MRKFVSLEIVCRTPFQVLGKWLLTTLRLLSVILMRSILATDYIVMDFQLILQIARAT